MVLKIAHRGASSYARENTMESFKKAIELGADVVEFDIRLSKDNKIVVIHDQDLKRVANHNGLVKDMTSVEIKKIFKKDGSFLTLHEAIGFLKNKCTCKIDIKERGMEERVIDVIKKNKMERSVIITTSIPEVVRKIKSISPDIEVEMGGFKKGLPAKKIIKKAKKVRADIIGPHHTITTKKLVKEAHKNKLKVHVWTVNKKKAIEKMKKIGVDGITTDSPDKV